MPAINKSPTAKPDGLVITSDVLAELVAEAIDSYVDIAN
jgi:hypothetical protein